MIRRAVLLLPPVLFLGLFLGYPLVTILGISFSAGEGVDLSGFGRIIGSAYHRELIIYTSGQAALATVITLGLALPAAGVFARYRWPGKSTMLALTTLPFVLPPVIVAAALLALVGERGLVNDALMSVTRQTAPLIRLERTAVIVIAAQVFYNFSVALRMIAGYWAAHSPRIEEAAQGMGVTGWRLWRQVRLPMLRPALFSAALLVFVFNFTSFGIMLILGGGQFVTLEVEIYTQTMSLFNLPLAGALSVVQIGVLLAVVLVYTRLQRTIITPRLTVAVAARLPVGWRQWRGVVAVNVALVLGIFAPLAALVVRSVIVNGELSFVHYGALASPGRGSVLAAPPLMAAGLSVGYALITTGLAVVLAVCAAYGLAGNTRRAGVSSVIDGLLMLPLTVSAVTLGLGFITALDEPPLNLRTSPLLVPIAHTLAALPFVIRSVLPALLAIPRSLREAAAVMGASHAMVLRRVDLPLVGRGMLVGASYAFTISMGEFGASLFVARPDAHTLPLVIYRLLGQPGASNYGQALAASVILLAICAFVFVLIERVQVGEGRAW